MHDGPKDEDHFAPPRSAIGQKFVEIVDFDPLEAKSLRMGLLGHEASIRAIGLLCYLFAAYVTLDALVALARSVGWIGVGDQGPAPDNESPWLMVLQGVLIYVTLIGLSTALGRGLVLFRSWARYTMMMFSLLILTVFVLGLVITVKAQRTEFSLFYAVIQALSLLLMGYCSTQLIRPKSALIFSARYRAAVASTPDLRPKAQWTTWLFVIFAVGFFLQAVFRFLQRI